MGGRAEGHRGGHLKGRNQQLPRAPHARLGCAFLSDPRRQRAWEWVSVPAAGIPSRGRRPQRRAGLPSFLHAPPCVALCRARRGNPRLMTEDTRAAS